jgi:oligo-1,6-glucosidase
VTLASQEPITGVDEPSEPWWRSAVVYQVYPRSFSDSNGDGIGDLEGIRQRLDHLQALGIDVIWLSPVYASPQDDNGYDISDYQAIDPMFGDFADFDRLIEDVHSRGMRLLMDLVVNHTSDEHAWFQESASSPGSAKRDWYWWRSPRPGHEGGAAGAEPNNWGSFFSGSAWEFDSASHEYYLHLFSRKQPDLNWENPAVRSAIYSMMLWWIDRGVDGFRMDVINFISKDPSLPDGGVAPGSRFGDGGPFYAPGPRIHEYLREMNEQVFQQRPGTFLTVGEMPGVTVDDAQLFTDSARREVDMVFQFDHVGLDHGPSGKFEHKPLDLVELKRSFAHWQDGLAERGWTSLYWNNHDQPRAVSRFGDDGEHWERSAKLLATVLHLQRGTPYIYQGEELGMTNTTFSSLSDFRDIETLNFAAEALASGRSEEELIAAVRAMSRDNARTPIQWSAAPGGGFSAAEPWIAVNPNVEHVNAASQVGTAGSIFEWYRHLIGLRHSDPLVVHGSFRLLTEAHPTLFAYTRTWQDRQWLVIANMSPDPLSVSDLVGGGADWSSATVILDNAAELSGRRDLLELDAWQVQVLERRIKSGR